MTQEELVLQYFREAELRASDIDRLLGLPSGKSHAIIVNWWKSKKEKSEAAEKGAGRGRNK